MKKRLGIYLHIPFCVQKCRYCDFCSFADRHGEYVEKYVAALCNSISSYASRLEDYEADTVYFGGGTPSFLSAGQIERIMNTLENAVCISPSAEITLECNPATADRRYFDDIRKMGVNRLSMGLQSASDDELALLGRIHTAEDFVKTYLDARAAGFDNISADLMYGIPSQTPDSLERSLRFLCALEPEHISAYGLTVEDGTYFARHRAELDLADDDMQAQMYLACGRILSEYGYEKYEVSNFAKEGKVSRHNVRYWRCDEYLGFGVAAHSYFGGERFGNSRDIDAFILGNDITEERATVDDRERAVEYVMLGLRLTEGIDACTYRSKFGRELMRDIPRAQEYVKNGFMTYEGGVLKFTDKGFLVSNAILSDILSF